MYVRPPSYRYQAPMRVPENYSGNTFREEPEVAPPEPVAEPEHAVETLEITSEESAAKPALLSQKGFSLRLGSLFGRDRGIGTEELLILALILLLSDTGDGEGFDDLILFLILLFFIK